MGRLPGTWVLLSRAICRGAHMLWTKPAARACAPLLPAGRRMLVTKADGSSTLLEVWGSGRLLRELQVPEALHGPVVNDNWFSRGAAWSPDESRVAYVAEVSPRSRAPGMSSRELGAGGAVSIVSLHADAAGWGMATHGGWGRKLGSSSRGQHRR